MSVRSKTTRKWKFKGWYPNIDDAKDAQYLLMRKTKEAKVERTTRPQPGYNLYAR
jgi:hypothetical protein